MHITCLIYCIIFWMFSASRCYRTAPKDCSLQACYNTISHIPSQHCKWACWLRTRCVNSEVSGGHQLKEGTIFSEPCFTSSGKSCWPNNGALTLLAVLFFWLQLFCRWRIAWLSSITRKFCILLLQYAKEGQQTRDQKLKAFHGMDPGYLRNCLIPITSSFTWSGREDIS